MAANPVFTDPNAFRASVPGTPPSGGVVDKSPVAAAVGRMADSLQRLGGILYQQDQQDRILRAQVGVAQGFQKLQQEVVQEPDWETMNAAFNEGAQKIETDAQELGHDQRTSTTIDLAYQRERLRAEANVTGVVLKKRAESYQANMAVRLDQIRQDAQDDPDFSMPEAKQAIAEMYQGGVMAGAITRDDAAKGIIAFNAEIDYVRARGMIQKSPDSAIELLDENGADGAPVNFQGLNPRARLSLKIEAENERSKLLSKLRADEVRAQKLANDQIKQDQDLAARELWDLHAQGNLTVDTLRERSSDLSLTEVEKLTRIVTAEGSARDDPQTFNSMWDNIYSGVNAQNGILEAGADGRLTGPTMQSMLTKNREIQRSQQPGGPPSPFDSAKKFLRESLGATTLLSKGDIGQEQRLARATLEFDAFGVEHPGASREEMNVEAERLVRRHALIDLTEKTIAHPTPYGVFKPRNKITTDDLSASAVMLQEAYKKGLIDAKKYGDEQKLIRMYHDGITERERKEADAPARGR